MSTPAKVHASVSPVTALPRASGGLRINLEDALVNDGQARSYTQAHSLIRDLPPRFASFCRVVIAVTPDRFPVINAEPLAVIDATDEAVLTAQLEREETQLDGHEDVAYDDYRTAPLGTAERALKARIAAHACYRNARKLNQKGRAILRAEGLV